MMLILVWLCLLTKATAFTTESPNKTEEEKPCCVGSPKLLYSGHDSKHNINFFWFEFVPLKKESKAKTNNKNEEHTAKLGLDGIENVASNTDAITKPEHEATETNTPAYPQDGDLNSSTKDDFTKGTSDEKQKTDSVPSGLSSNITQSNIPKNDLDVDTNANPHDSDNNSETLSNFSNDHSIKGGDQKDDKILSGTSKNATKPNNPTYHTDSGPKGVSQHKLYGEYGSIQNLDIALKDQAKHTYNSEILKANEQSVTDGYYSTDGITLTDIPGYNDSKVAEQDPDIRFPSKDIDMLKCTETNGVCKNDQVSNPPTHKKVHLDTKGHMNVVHSIKNQTSKLDGRQQKIVQIEKNKSNKSPGQPNKNNKRISTKSSTGRDPRNGKAHQRWYNNEQFRHHRYHKHSSSESTSDSSQEFD